MFKKMRFVLLFGVSLFIMALCFQEDDVTKPPTSMPENPSKVEDMVQRLKRQIFRPGFPAARVQSRAPTVIVVPERGNIPAYGNYPMSPYAVNTPNRGTTVVVSQAPEYNYNDIGRTYGVVPTL